MEDELDQEDMEEEIAPSKKKAGKGSPLKMIIILVVLLVVAVVLVFGVIMPMFVGDQVEEGEEPEEEVIDTRELTEYGEEFVVPTITISMRDDRGRVRNIVVDVTFEITKKGLSELEKRSGLIKDKIIGVVKSFNFDVILTEASRDSMQTQIKREINRRLPLKQKDKIKSTVLSILTQ